MSTQETPKGLVWVEKGFFFKEIKFRNSETVCFLLVMQFLGVNQRNDY